MNQPLPDQKPCEVCGKPSCHAAADFKATIPEIDPNGIDLWETQEFAGTKHWWCDEHFHEPEIKPLLADMTPMQRVKFFAMLWSLYCWACGCPQGDCKCESEDAMKSFRPTDSFSRQVCVTLPSCPACKSTLICRWCSGSTP